MVNNPLANFAAEHSGSNADGNAQPSSSVYSVAGEGGGSQGQRSVSGEGQQEQSGHHLGGGFEAAQELQFLQQQQHHYLEQQQQQQSGPATTPADTPPDTTSCNYGNGSAANNGGGDGSYDGFNNHPAHNTNNATAADGFAESQFLNPVRDFNEISEQVRGRQQQQRQQQQQQQSNDFRDVSIGTKSSLSTFAGPTATVSGAHSAAANQQQQQSKLPPSCLKQDGNANPHFFKVYRYFLHYVHQPLENRFLEHRTRHANYRLLLALSFLVTAAAAEGFVYHFLGYEDQDRIKRQVIVCVIMAGIETALCAMEHLYREQMVAASEATQVVVPSSSSAHPEQQQQQQQQGFRHTNATTGGGAHPGLTVPIVQRNDATLQQQQQNQGGTNSLPVPLNQGFLRTLWLRELLCVLTVSYLAVEFGYFGPRESVDRCIWIETYEHRPNDTRCSNHLPGGFDLLTLLLPVILGRPRFILHFIPAVAAVVAAFLHSLLHDHLSETEIDHHDWVTARWTRVVYIVGFAAFSATLKYIDESRHRRQFEAAMVMQAQTRMLKRRERSLANFVNSLVPSFLRKRLVVEKGFAEFAADVSSNSIVMALDVEASFLLSTQLLPHDAAVKLGFISAICSGIRFSWIKRPSCASFCHHIRSVGDSSIMVGGLFDARPAATAFIIFANYIRTIVHNLPLRIGIADGSLVGMPIGHGNIRYDVFGPALQEAQGLVSTCPARRLSLSRSFYDDLAAEKIVERFFYYQPSVEGLAAHNGLPPKDSTAAVIVDDVQIQADALMAQVQGTEDQNNDTTTAAAPPPPPPPRTPPRTPPPQPDYDLQYDAEESVATEPEAVVSPPLHNIVSRGDAQAEVGEHDEDDVNHIVSSTKAMMLRRRSSAAVSTRLVAPTGNGETISIETVKACFCCCCPACSCCEGLASSAARTEQQRVAQANDKTSFRVCCTFVAIEALVIAVAALIDRRESLDDNMWIAVLALIISSGALLFTAFRLTTNRITTISVIIAASASVLLNIGAALTRPSVVGDDTTYLAVGVMSIFIFSGETALRNIMLQIIWAVFYAATLIIRPLITVETPMVIGFTLAVTLVMTLARTQLQREIFRDTIKSQLANEAVKEQHEIREALVRGSIPKQIQWRLEGDACSSGALDSWNVETCIVISVSFFQHDLSSSQHPSYAPSARSSTASSPVVPHAVRNFAASGGGVTSGNGSSVGSVYHHQQHQQHPSTTSTYLHGGDDDDNDNRRAFKQVLTQQPDDFRQFIEARTAVIEDAVAKSRHKTIEIVNIFCGTAVLAGPLEDRTPNNNAAAHPNTQIGDDFADQNTHLQRQAKAVADAMTIIQHLLAADLSLTVGVALEQGINVLRQTEFPAHDIFGPAVNISRALMMEASFPMVCATDKVVQFFDRECCEKPKATSLTSHEDICAARDTRSLLRFGKSEAWRIRGLGSIRVHQIALQDAPGGGGSASLVSGEGPLSSEASSEHGAEYSASSRNVSGSLPSVSFSGGGNGGGVNSSTAIGSAAAGTPSFGSIPRLILKRAPSSGGLLLSPQQGTPRQE